MGLLEDVMPLITVLFLLSMVCERIADFLKHFLCGNKLFSIGDTITKHDDDAKEQARAYRILKINVWAGIIVAGILKADMLDILTDMKKPTEAFGWNHFVAPAQWWGYLKLVAGVFLTGCFISFGSKFWHDLLDLLYQIKNAKRVLSDPETYQIDQIRSLENAVNTYQSDFIKAAYLEAQSRFMAFPTVKAFSIRSNDSGHYFEVTVNQFEPAINPVYQYLMDDGRPQNIPVKILLLGAGEKIEAHSLNLASQIFDINDPSNFGTLGLIVKSVQQDNTDTYLLTCCHNLVKPMSRLPLTQTVKAGSQDEGVVSVGTVVRAERDHEMDAALIKIDPSAIARIFNAVPSRGQPQHPRQLVNSDAGKTTAFVYGNVSGPVGGVKQATVDSIYNTIKIEYSGGEEFTLINMIGIAKDGKAVSRGGDSGACVMDEDNNVLGLVVGGSPSMTYVIPIFTLLNKLQVQLTKD